MPPEAGTLDTRVEAAFRTWSRSAFAAPRSLRDCVTNVEPHTETLHRVATQVAHREVVEVRTATRERRSTPPRLDPAKVDPFVFDIPQLKAASEYVEQCKQCRASGTLACAGCNGTGSRRCSNCGGTGKEVQHFKNGNSRLIKCKVCPKASGIVGCHDCGSSGNVTCSGCRGSGHVLAWLETVESIRWLLALSESPTIVSHPYLREQRLLAPQDLAAFDSTDATRVDGPLNLAALTDSGYEMVDQHLRSLDHRSDRVLAQQYLRLSVPRQDITYEMCGAQATVVLSGRDLRAATTPETTKPIRRRVKVWIALIVLLMIGLVAVQKAVLGTSVYFADTKATTDALAGAAILISIPTFGVFLRTWRGGLRFWRIPVPTLAGLVSVALATLSLGFIGLLSRPTAGEVTSALAAGNVARARQVVTAIEERDRSPAVSNLDDQVTLAEANKQIGAPRLALLDKVAARGGSAAPTASAAARADRLAVVRKIADARDTKTALADLDRDFPGDKANDPLVAEERAHAYDVAKAACATPACQYNDALAASTARTTVERTAAVDATRTALVAGLDHAQVSAKDTLPRLQQLRTVRDLANETLATPKLDADLATLATATRDWANGERAKVPMLWSEAPVVSELVAEGAAPSDAIELKGTTVVPAFAGNHKCSGVYAIGNADASRSYNSTSWPPERLLSQAVGKPATIHKPANNDVTTTSWYESGFPVVARWRSGQLVELRIGDAAP